VTSIDAWATHWEIGCCGSVPPPGETWSAVLVFSGDGFVGEGRLYEDNHIDYMDQAGFERWKTSGSVRRLWSFLESTVSIAIGPMRRVGY